MPTINATIRNGRIEPDEPLNLPDGTTLKISVPDDDEDSPEAIARDLALMDQLKSLKLAEANPGDESMSPEEIARVLAALDDIIPFDRSPEEEARLEADRLARKEWEKAHFFERADKLGEMWNCDEPFVRCRSSTS